MSDTEAAPATLNRSNFVTALAWTFIVFSGFATLISVAQNVLIHTVFPMEQIDAATASAPSQVPAVFRFILAHIRIFFFLFLAISATTLVSAIGLLYRKNWARRMFITLLALGVLWNLGSLIAQQTILNSIPPMQDGVPQDFQAHFETMANLMRIFSAVTALAFCTLFAWLIKRLSSRSVRAEFLPAQIP